ncbi:hypothetical protein R6Q57_010732 [Mikania cordata]
MSAVLLRRIITVTTDDESQSQTLYPSLSPATQSALKSTLLESVGRESSKSISKKLCDTVSELASLVLPENGWPELLPFMFQCVTSGNPRHRESALLIFAQLAQYIGETLIPHLDTLHAVFLGCLGAGIDPDVRIAALNASINFIQCLENASDRDKFHDLLPLMMQTLTGALISGEESTAQDALELLIELAGTEPRFLKKQITEVVGSMLQIAEAETLEEGTKHLALEFVITLAEAREKAPGMMRKLPQFIKRLFEILMKMLLDVEDDPAWHSAEVEHEDAGESSNYSAGQEYLDRLSISLGGNTIVPVVSEILPAYLAAPEWQKHHAALIAIAQIAEGCSKVMTKSLEQVVSMVLNSFHDPHPRLDGRLLMQLVSSLQTWDQTCKLSIIILCCLLWLQQWMMFIIHGCSSSKTSTSMELYDLLYWRLKSYFVKQVVKIEHFEKYYDAVMPYLKVILVNATDKNQSHASRAKSMECISLVGMAVGKGQVQG